MRVQEDDAILVILCSTLRLVHFIIHTCPLFHTSHCKHFSILSSFSWMTNSSMPIVSLFHWFHLLPLLFFLFNHYTQMLRSLFFNPVSSFSSVSQLGFSRFLIFNEITARKSRMGTSCYTTSSGQTARLLFRQLFEKESSTYTYLLADASHPQKPAVVRFFLTQVSDWFLFVWCFGRVGFRVVSVLVSANV